jgi:hypothetical protein
MNRIAFLYGLYGMALVAGGHKAAASAHAASPPPQYGDRQAGSFGDIDQGHFGDASVGNFIEKDGYSRAQEGQVKSVDAVPTGHASMFRKPQAQPDSPYVSLPAPADAAKR